MVQGGHAIVAVLTEGATPVYKATIVPRGSALGMVTQLADKDEVHMTLQQMLARLDVCMGGRVAEEVRPPPHAEVDSRHALCCARPRPPPASCATGCFWRQFHHVRGIVRPRSRHRHSTRHGGEVRRVSRDICTYTRVTSHTIIYIYTCHVIHNNIHIHVSRAACPQP